MGLYDYILEKTLKIPHALLHRHDCPADDKGLIADALPPGTPVYCYFPFGIAEHSGICIGDTIVHLNGKGEVVCTGPDDFLAMDLDMSIYYAADNNRQPISARQIAVNASSHIGKCPGYNLLNSNCHGFTRGCIRGFAPRGLTWSIRDVENAISHRFGIKDWHWRRWETWNK